MSSIKKLASQTIWYGLSTILYRFIGYLQTPIITYLLPDSRGQQAYGEFSILFACISIANIIFTYGMETAYFRYAEKVENKERLFRTSFGTLLISTILLSLFFILLRHPISHFIEQEAHPEYVTWAIIIIAFDTLSAIPFARLRQEGRPKKYAAIRITAILCNLLLTFAVLYFSQNMATAHPDSEFALWYNSHSKGGLLLIPNMAQSIITFLLLWREWKSFRWDIDQKLLSQLWKYGSPMIIVGLGGMINETMDRPMLAHLYNGSEAEAKIAVGIYSANYRIAIFITLFVQAFKMSAEPFFFREAVEKNAARTYAIVMKWFVITLCVAFLFSALYLDIWKHLVSPNYRTGLVVVPILLGANIFLGIYYNLLVPFKITDNMRKATYITLIGAAITLFVNFTFIPQFGMLASAWATFICYFIMMLIAYRWGQKLFPIQYPLRNIGRYFVLMIFLYIIYLCTYSYTTHYLVRILSSGILMLCFLLYVLHHEKLLFNPSEIIKKIIRKK